MMTKPVPSNTVPAPTAVPWTPDMMTQGHPPAQLTQQQMQPQNMNAAPQMAQNHMVRNQMPQNQGAPYPQGTSQPAYPQAPQPYDQGYAQPAHQAPAPQYGMPPQMQVPNEQPYAQSYAAMSLQTGGHVRGQMPAHPQDQYAMAGAPVEAVDAPASKSLLAKLLKRKPKVAAPDVVRASESTGQSESLFNKNFVMGAVTGLVIGAFILPMVLGVFTGDAPVGPQAQTRVAPVVQSSSLVVEGETFIDTAVGTETP